MQYLVLNFYSNRSPSFLGTKLKRWSGEKKEIVIEDCDPQVLDIVVNYMYGIKIPDLVYIVMKYERNICFPLRIVESLSKSSRFLNYF